MKKRPYTYPDGSVYEGEWRAEKRHGYGMLTMADKTRYVGYWAQDKPNGQGLLTSPDGSSYSGEWKEGKRDGQGILIRADGTRLSGDWRAGQFVGENELLLGSREKALQKQASGTDHCREIEKTNWVLRQKIAELEEDSGRGRKRGRAITFRYLRRFNLIMGLLHFAQGILMLSFALTIDQVKAFKTPVWSYFLEFNSELMRLVTRPEQIGEVPFGLFVSFFLLLSALAHFVIVYPATNKIYVENLKIGINRFRWYEYSLSSSLMIILIAMLFGVYDIGALIAIFILNASMNLFGLLMEEINRYTDKTNWAPFIFGCIAGIGPWIVIILHALGNADPAEVPWFVYAIIGSYFVFFNLFPVNMVLQYLKVGKWADYLYGERYYILLSLVAKSVLAWLVFSGVMQPS